MRRLVLIGFLVLATVVCGRYKTPIPPEMLAPRAVDGLQIKGTAIGVSLAWTAPDEDRRGKELKSIQGYSIERKPLVQRGDETDPKVKFEKLGFVTDKHVQVREKLRAEARAAGKVGRTIESPEEHTKFSFMDSTAKLSSTYLYKVVPHNQGGIEGVVGQVARVTFKGEASDVLMVTGDEAGQNDGLPTGQEPEQVR